MSSYDVTTPLLTFITICVLHKEQIGIFLQYSEPSIVWISEARSSPQGEKKIRTEMHGTFTIISSADKNK
jgi:hypothetical protein